MPTPPSLTRPRAGRRAASLAAAFATAALTACGEPPTGPYPAFADAALRCPEAGVVLCAGGEPVAAAHAVVDDAAGRLAGSLGDAAAGTRLSRVLRDLGCALRAGEVSRARSLQAAAHAALSGAVAAARPSDLPDLAAIELTLAQTDYLLTSGAR